MTPFAWLLGLILPACGAPGAQGLPPPELMDMSRIERPGSPNTALAAPAGSLPRPDIVTPVFPVPATRLYSVVLDVAAGQARTFLAKEYPTQLQAHFVARSAFWNFPDLITAQVGEAGPRASTLALYSRSVYGHSDFGVNRQRLEVWLAAVQIRINHPDER